jgi:hypothetical protein
MDLQQATMILTALKSGWTVTMNDCNELIFTKDKQKMTPEEQIEVVADGFSSKFLQSLIKKN